MSHKKRLYHVSRPDYIIRPALVVVRFSLLSHSGGAAVYGGLLTVSRRLAREAVFKALFQIDIGKCGPEAALRRAIEDFHFSPDEKEYIGSLLRETVKRLLELDGIIREHLVKWKLERLSAVDRNLLRLALCEILHRPDIPPAVSINEALELAKKYGSSVEAVGFINGVLDRTIGRNVARES